MPKLPAIQLYPGDWYRDDVSGCSLAAQGLWLRMMFIGHDADRYGYLAKNGAPIPPESIARRCGCTPEQYATLLAELEASGVFSRTPEGSIYCRRMVRDSETRSATKKRVKEHREKQLSNARVTQQYEDEVEDEKEGVDCDSDFRKLAGIWEKGAGESRAQQAYCELLDQGEKPDAIFGGLKAIDAMVRETWERDQLRYLPKLATMLSGKRYKETPILWDRQDPANQLAMEAKVGGR